MGRPTLTLTPEQVAEVETLAAVLSSEQVADYFGISRSAFYAMLRRDPGIEARYKRGKAKAVGAIAQTLISKARAGDTTSMIFYLKTQGGWRETAGIDHEHRLAASHEADAAMEVFTTLLDGIAQEKRKLGQFIEMPVATPESDVGKVTGS
jgi:hypothetical protein